MAYVKVVKEATIYDSTSMIDDVNEIAKIGDIIEVEDYICTYFFEKTKTKLDDNYNINQNRYDTLKIKYHEKLYIDVGYIIILSKSEIRKMKLNKLKNGLC
jgi:hypothetical protein